MRKEILFTISVILFVISTGIDKINGPLKILLKQPYAFLKPNVLTTYPFTGVAILVKVVAVVLLIWVILALIPKRFLLKFIILMVTALLAQLYAIQQLATGLRVTPVEWTLAIAYSGLVLIPLGFILLLTGAISGLKNITRLPTHEAAENPSGLAKPKPLKTPKNFQL